MNVLSVFWSCRSKGSNKVAVSESDRSGFLIDLVEITTQAFSFLQNFGARVNFCSSESFEVITIMRRCRCVRGPDGRISSSVRRVIKDAALVLCVLTAAVYLCL